MAKTAKIEETTGTTETEAATKITKPRISPVIIGISAAVAMPTNRGGRGGKTTYDWDALEVGQSIAIANKTKKQLASIVTNANKKFAMKDAEGKTVAFSKRFFSVDCDPSTDPEGASVRIFREA